MTPEVRFLPGGETVAVDLGITVLGAARMAGVPIAASCAGRGTCGSCAIRLIEGELGNPDDVEFKAMARLPKSVRLACRATITGSVTVEPLTKVRNASPDIQTPAGGITSLHDVDDTDYIPPAPTKQQPTASSSAAPPSPQAALVVGVDLGTTNVSATVADRATGRVVGSGTVPNRQGSWGADVLTRLSLSLAGDAGPLRNAAQMSILEAIEEALGTSISLASRSIERVVIAANSVMAALLVGADASGLAVAPFAPLYGLSLTEGPMARRLPAGTEVVVLDPLAAFVGGDIRAGLIATVPSVTVGDSADSDRSHSAASEPQLLIDMGTNAEVALWAGGTLYVASAPAGSALEGIGSGTERVSGSALIAHLFEARSRGALDVSGLLDESHASVVRSQEGVLCYAAGGAAVITQLDVRSIQLAKSAVRAAAEHVLSAAGLTASELAGVYVAGAFGGAVPAEHLVQLGFVPEVDPETVHFAGNTSLTGAVSIALGASAEISIPIHHVELAQDPQFSRVLMSHTAFSSH